MDKNGPEEPLAIFLYDLESGTKRRLTTPPPSWLGDSSPAFFADGKSLAFVRTVSAAVQDIYIAPVSGGEPRRLTSDNRRIFGMAYHHARGELVFSSNRNSIARLWKVTASGAAPEPIMGIGENASFLAISREVNRLAYTRSTTDTNVALSAGRWRRRAARALSLDLLNPAGTGSSIFPGRPAHRVRIQSNRFHGDLDM